MKLLLIEDNDVVARTLVRAFKMNGHETHHVAGIGAAFDYIFEGGKPDVVVTDRNVVGGDAWSFVLQAVTLGHLPNRVVFMSGCVPDDVIPPAFWSKGGNLEDLLKLIDGGTKL